jgi:hypothetical protein
MTHHDALSFLGSMRARAHTHRDYIENMRHYASCVMVGDEKASPTDARQASPFLASLPVPGVAKVVVK